MEEAHQKEKGEVPGKVRKKRGRGRVIKGGRDDYSLEGFRQRAISLASPSRLRCPSTRLDAWSFAGSFQVW